MLSAVIAVSRYAGVDPTNPVAAPPNVVRANANGSVGACSGGSQGAAYSVPFATTGYGSVVHAAAAVLRASHAPGAGYTELAEIDEGNGNNQVGMAVMRQTRVVPEPVTVDGSLDQDADWAVAAVEIRQQVYFRPTVASFSPGVGGPGTEVVVGGANFTGASVVRFGSKSASFALDSDAQIRATVPSGDASGPIAVTNPAGTGTSAASFVSAGECANGVDDDADGLLDFPADPGCGDAFSATESPQCDDGSPCTTDDVCQTGTCVGAPRNCSDDDACTVDSCDSAGGAFLCEHVDCNTVSGSSCPVQCSPPSCGNGVVDPGETCDPPDPTIDPVRLQARCRPDCTRCGLCVDVCPTGALRYELKGVKRLL